MALKALSIRLDSDIKSSFDLFCRSVGMNPTTAINLFVNTVVREQRIPFEITTARIDPFYSDVNQKYLLESIVQLDHGEGH